MPQSEIEASNPDNLEPIPANDVAGKFQEYKKKPSTLYERHFNLDSFKMH